MGVSLVGRAYNQSPAPDSLFTPSHLVLYSGFFVNAAFAYVSLIRGRLIGRRLSQALAPGYGLYPVGAAIIVIGGLVGLAWVRYFGIDTNIRALPSPIHLVLALGCVIMVIGPFRSASGSETGDSVRLAIVSLLPAVLSLTYVLSIITFFTQFAHPLVEPLAAVEVSGLKVFGEIHIMSADGSDQTRFTTSPESADWDPRWSPDGSSIAFVSKRNGISEIYTASVDGTEPIRLTFNQDRDWGPSWSPDGDDIAFASNRDGNFEIYVMNADGAEQARLTRSIGDDLNPFWSPDGKMIAFASERDGDFEIYVMNADGGGQIRLTRSNGADLSPSWSPDGNKIAFASERDGNSEIYVMNADGSNQFNSTRNESIDKHPSWSPDGGKVAFVSERDGNFEVYVINTDGKEPVNLTRNPGAEDDLPSWSPKSERIAYASGGRPRLSPENLGVASIALQAGLLMGAVLLAMRRWKLPPGSLTILFTVNAALMSTQEETYYLVPGAIAAGLVADGLLWLVRRSDKRVLSVRMFSYSVPTIYYAFYFLALSVTQGIGWPLELWSGSILLAGFTGLLLSYLLIPSGELASGNTS